MTLNACRFTVPRWPKRVALALALGMAISPAALAQDVTTPTQGDPPADNIQELRDAIRRLKERVAAFSGDRTATPEALEDLRTEALDQIEAIDQMQRDLGIEPPPEDTASSALTIENQRLRTDLDEARQETVLLERQQEQSEAQRTKEQEDAAAEIAQLRDAMTTASAETGDLRAALAQAKTLAAEALEQPRHDPADIARIQDVEAELEARTVEIAKLDAEGETLRADLGSCARARDDAETRAEIPEAKAWQALQTENQTLEAENVANDQRLNDAMAIAERCVGQTSGKGDRLGQALREIEALEAALARERALNR